MRLDDLLPESERPKKLKTDAPKLDRKAKPLGLNDLRDKPIPAPPEKPPESNEFEPKPKRKLGVWLGIGGVLLAVMVVVIAIIAGKASNPEDTKIVQAPDDKANQANENKDSTAGGIEELMVGPREMRPASRVSIAPLFSATTPGSEAIIPTDFRVRRIEILNFDALVEGIRTPLKQKADAGSGGIELFWGPETERSTFGKLETREDNSIRISWSAAIARTGEPKVARERFRHAVLRLTGAGREETQVVLLGDPIAMEPLSLIKRVTNVNYLADGKRSLPFESYQLSADCSELAPLAIFAKVGLKHCVLEIDGRKEELIAKSPLLHRLENRIGAKENSIDWSVELRGRQLIFKLTRYGTEYNPPPVPPAADANAAALAAYNREMELWRRNLDDRRPKPLAAAPVIRELEIVAEVDFGSYAAVAGIGNGGLFDARFAAKLSVEPVDETPDKPAAMITSLEKVVYVPSLLPDPDRVGGHEIVHAGFDVSAIDLLQWESVRAGTGLSPALNVDPSRKWIEMRVNAKSDEKDSVFARIELRGQRDIHFRWADKDFGMDDKKFRAGFERAIIKLTGSGGQTQYLVLKDPVRIDPIILNKDTSIRNRSPSEPGVSYLTDEYHTAQTIARLGPLKDTRTICVRRFAITLDASEDLYLPTAADSTTSSATAAWASYSATVSFDRDAIDARLVVKGLPHAPRPVLPANATKAMQDRYAIDVKEWNIALLDKKPPQFSDPPRLTHLELGYTIDTSAFVTLARIGPEKWNLPLPIPKKKNPGKKTDPKGIVGLTGPGPVFYVSSLLPNPAKPEPGSVDVGFPISQFEIINIKQLGEGLKVKVRTEIDKTTGAMRILWGPESEQLVFARIGVKDQRTLTFAWGADIANSGESREFRERLRSAVLKIEGGKKDAPRYLALREPELIERIILVRNPVKENFANERKSQLYDIYSARTSLEKFTWMASYPKLGLNKCTIDYSATASEKLAATKDPAAKLVSTVAIQDNIGIGSAELVARGLDIRLNYFGKSFAAVPVAPKATDSAVAKRNYQAELDAWRQSVIRNRPAELVPAPSVSELEIVAEMEPGVFVTVLKCGKK